jgi:hypothetical protein
VLDPYSYFISVVTGGGYLYALEKRWAVRLNYQISLIELGKDLID